MQSIVLLACGAWNQPGRPIQSVVFLVPAIEPQGLHLVGSANTVAGLCAAKAQEHSN